MKHLSLLFAAAFLAVALPARADDPAVTRVPVAFSGGHDTDPRDGGRPVILVASALGVAPEVFRETFTHVHPAGPGSGGPTPDEARANKRALLDGLAKYGVTNDRLDEVSNRYRYMKSKGELWPVKEAVANALIKNNVVVGYEVVDGGYGYTTPPTVTVTGITLAGAMMSPVVTLSFGPDFVKNGTVSAIVENPAVQGRSSVPVPLGTSR